jgi:hypothetical protein
VSPPPDPRISATILQPATTEQFNFRFAAGREFKEQFERLAEVLGVENPLKRMAEILEQAVDMALDRKDLKRRLERRAKRSTESTAESRPGQIPNQEPTSSRYIPSEVRERVHARAAYQCEYRGPDGTRCRSRTGLEIEHERPFAIYHSHDESDLKLFCRQHNRLSAERVYGAAFIQDKIHAARGRADSQRDLLGAPALPLE